MSVDVDVPDPVHYVASLQLWRANARHALPSLYATPARTVDYAPVSIKVTEEGTDGRSFSSKSTKECVKNEKVHFCKKIYNLCA